MRNMKRIILGRFPVLPLLIFSSSFSNWQCEAGVILVGDSGNVSLESININNNTLSLEESAQVADENRILPVSGETESVKLEHEEVDNNRNDNKLNKTVHENSIAQRASPCPITGHSESGADEKSRSDANQENDQKPGSNVTTTNNNNKSPGVPLVKEEKHGTALEHISDGIADIIRTIKHSVTSIFSPGEEIPFFGQGRIGDEVNCYRHPSIGGNVSDGSGANVSTSLSSNEAVPGASDKEKHDGLDDADHSRLSSDNGEEQAAERLLIHPDSSNGTSTSTSETGSTTTPITTPTLPTTLSPEEIATPTVSPMHEVKQE